jgi:hypothetical protein
VSSVGPATLILAFGRRPHDPHELHVHIRQMSEGSSIFFGRHEEVRASLAAVARMSRGKRLFFVPFVVKSSSS